MKRLLTTFFVCSMLLTTSVAQTQQGVTYRYNGKQKRTPLCNVTITYDSNQRSVLSGASDGQFSLLLTGKKMGDRIGLVTVKKRDMMVFNQHAVDEWSVRKEPLRVILCDADEFEQQKENLIAIGKREAKKKYDKQKAVLETQLQEGKVKLQEYEAALDKAYEELERARKHMDEYADLFARIDESEIDTLAQHAMDLFNQGEVEQAIKKFEEGNFMERLRQDNRVIQQADQMIRTAEEAKQQAMSDREAHINSIKAQIEAYKVQNDWTKAGALLKNLADELNTPDEMLAYADFCMQQQQFGDAETYYRKYLSLLASDSSSAGHEHRVSLGYNRMGVVCQRLKRYAEAEDYLKKALSIGKEMYREADNETLMDLSSYYNNLGNFYRELSRFDEAEQMYRQSLDLKRKLYSRSSVYASTLSDVLNNLGTMYWDENKLAECETCYEEALKLRRKEAQSNENEKLADLASSIDNMASLFSKKGDKEQCEKLHLEALALRRQLATRNPQAYSEQLAYSLGNLGNLYQTSLQLDKCLPLYEEALTVFEKLSENNPLAYQSEIAMTQMNMGVLYMALGDNDSSIKHFQEALPIFQSLAKRQNKADYPYLAMLQVNLGMAYTAAGRYRESDEVLAQAISSYGQLAQQSPSAFNPYLAVSFNASAFNKMFLQQFAEAETLVRQAITLDTTQSVFQTTLAISLLFQGKYAEAEAIYRQYKSELKDSFLGDLKQFAEAGVISKEREEDVEKIKKLLEE